MKKIFVVTLIIAIMLAMTACKDTFDPDDDDANAYAFVTTSTGQSYTLPACRAEYGYYADHLAIHVPNELYLEVDETATISFACTECGYNEIVEDVMAPDAFYFECTCIIGDNDSNLPEAMVINLILGSPPAEEG